MDYYKGFRFSTALTREVTKIKNESKSNENSILPGNPTSHTLPLLKVSHCCAHY